MPRFPTSGPQCRCRRSGRPDTAAGCSPRWFIYQSPLNPMPTRPRAHRVSMTHVRRRGPVNCRVPHAGAADRFSTCECGSIDARRIRSGMPRLAACGAKREPAWAPQSKHAADGPGPVLFQLDLRVGTLLTKCHSGQGLPDNAFISRRFWIANYFS